MSGFFVLDPEESGPQVFVQFWRRAYQADQSTYDRNIRLGSMLESDNVERLMRWKAGRRFQASATAFAKAIPLETLNSHREHHGTLTDAEVEALHDEITNSLRSAGLRRAGNIIWSIFLCHVAHPQARQFTMSMFGERGDSSKAGLSSSTMTSDPGGLALILSSGHGTMTWSSHTGLTSKN
jgi:hypothetical protein